MRKPNLDGISGLCLGDAVEGAFKERAAQIAIARVGQHDDDGLAGELGKGGEARGSQRGCTAAHARKNAFLGSEAAGDYPDFAAAVGAAAVGQTGIMPAGLRS